MVIDCKQKNQLKKAFDDENNYEDILLSIFYDEREADVENFLDVLMKNSCMRPLVYWIKEIRDKAYKLNLYDEETDCFIQKQASQPYIVCIMLDSDHAYENETSITQLDIKALINKSQDGFLRRVVIVGDNVMFEKKCVKISVDVCNVWDLYNIKSSVEYGVILQRYCSWVIEKGLQYARNEEVEVTFSVNGVVIFVHLQHTPAIVYHGKELQDPYPVQVEEMENKLTNLSFQNLVEVEDIPQKDKSKNKGDEDQSVAKQPDMPQSARVVETDLEILHSTDVATRAFFCYDATRCPPLVATEEQLLGEHEVPQEATCDPVEEEEEQEKLEKSTQKHRRFVAEPMGDKDVIKLAGIDPIYAARLREKGFEKAYSVLGKFLVLNKKEELFVDWITDACGANRRHAEECYKCLEEWCDANL